jgi:hypothetical protein
VAALWQLGCAVRVQSAAFHGRAGQVIPRELRLQLVDGVRSVAAGVGIALSGVPMVCQRESHKTRLVVELFVVFRA